MAEEIPWPDLLTLMVDGPDLPLCGTIGTDTGNGPDSWRLYDEAPGADLRVAMLRQQLSGR